MDASCNDVLSYRQEGKMPETHFGKKKRAQWDTQEFLGSSNASAKIRVLNSKCELYPTMALFRTAAVFTI